VIGSSSAQSRRPLATAHLKRNLPPAIFVVKSKWKPLERGDDMRRLYRSRTNKVIAGICGGIAEYFDVDPVLIRIIAILFLFTGGAALIAYIIGIIIIPYSPQQEYMAGTAEQTPPPPLGRTGDFGHSGSLIVGIVLTLIGINLLFRNFPFFGRYYGWFWGVGWPFFWPSILIVLGLLVIFLGSSRKT
jgi:phage shock protein C